MRCFRRLRLTCHQRRRRSPAARSGGRLCATLLLLAFAPTLWSLAIHAAGSDLHSHVLLIPFVSAYLIYIQRERLPKRFVSSPTPGFLAGMTGLATMLAARLASTSLSGNDYLALMTFSFICFLVALGFIFLGRAWMASVAFPVGFLFFMVPMPDAMANALEIGSQLASAEAANLFFIISGTPFLREGLNFQLPNIALRVAQECSGIRSSWVLFITSVLASYLFLQSPWRRAALVLFIFPLAILRNGFRIMVIGLLVRPHRAGNDPQHHSPARWAAFFCALANPAVFAALVAVERRAENGACE